MDRGNIYLVGMMGTGKTTIGRKLAGKLDYQFIDLDEYIEKEQGRKISDIFALEGEERFRDLETEALIKLRTLCQVDKPRIVATGGGAYERKSNRTLMRDSGKTVWLITSVQEIAKRLATDTSRPLLQSNEELDLELRLTSLLQKREKNYRQADIHIITDGKTIEERIEEIIKKIQSSMK